jgi:uncharacterized protein
MILQVTLCTSAAMALLTIWMLSRTGRLRQQTGIIHGDGGHDLLTRRMRAQLNFVESAPFVLALIALIELSGRGQPWLAFVAAIYVLGRVLHVFGMDRADVARTRIAGVAITMLTLLGLAVVAALIAAGVY